MKVSEVQLKAMFAEIAEKHEQINSFFWGDIIRATRDREVEQYPLLSVYIAGTGGNFNARLVGTPLVVTVVDRVNKDDSTLDDTSSDTERVVKQIYNILERSKRWQRLLTVRSTTNVRLYEAQSDWLAGHTCTITVDRKDSRSVCDIPIVDYDFDSDFSPICSPVTVQNSSENYSVEVDSGSTLTLPDTTVEVNGDDKGDVPSIDTLNVKLSDSGGTVVPDSVSIVGSDVNITLPDQVISYIGAQLLKTGQTTSDRTGDDGDIEAGRGSSTLVLRGNNPFGNPNRFTKTNGTAGTVGTVEWIIDWDTYDEVTDTVLGFVNFWWSLGTFTWDDAVDFSLAYSLDGFSGCRLGNKRELNNIIDDELGIGYQPILNSSVSLNTWSSTTLRLSISFAYFTNFHDGRMQYQAKTNTYYAFPVRTFTVNGTTLT